MKMPPLSSLRAFEATARHLSFSRAGDELFVTHAAISHQVRQLEEWFEMKLFLRQGRSIKLTRPGEALFRNLSPALIQIAETCARVKAMGDKETLTVGCIPSIASRWLVPNLQRFTKIKPDLEVSVMYASSNQEFSRGDLDVLITLGRENSVNVESNHLFSRLTKPVCSPKFLEKHGPFVSPEHIAQAPLLHDEDREGWRAWCEVADIQWSEGDSWPVYQDFNLLVTAAIAGHGIALCPVEPFSKEIERGDLIILSNLSTNQDAAYYASFSKTARPSIRTFVDWFSSLASE